MKSEIEKILRGIRPLLFSQSLTHGQDALFPIQE